jgi:hypothetical protein
MATLKTTIDYFTSNFGNTPGGVKPVMYAKGGIYNDNTSSPNARVTPQNQNTPGAKDSGNLVETLFISVEKNKNLLEGGVTLLCVNPKAFKYQTNQAGQIIDPRTYVNFRFGGNSFLELSQDGKTLNPPTVG